MEKEPKKRRNPYRPSLRAALNFAIAFAVAPALAIIAWTGAENGIHRDEDARREALRQTDAFAEIQIGEADAARRLLATIASFAPVRQGDADGAAALLRSAHAANPDYLNLTLTDTAGFVVASSRLKAGADLSMRSHIRRATADGAFRAGDYFRNLLDQSPSIAFSQPVFDEAGTMTGVVSLGITLESYGRLFDRFALPEDSILGLVDGNGVRLYYYPPKDTNPIGEAIQESVWKRIRSGGGRGVFTESGRDGISRFYSYRSLTLPGSAEPYLHVVYALPDRKIKRESRNALFRNLALMAAVALIGFAGASFLSRSLFGKRLARVISVADRLREGDLGARVGAEGDRSDLGHLAAAVDSLAATLQERAAESRRYAASLSASLAEKDVLLKEVHHRVKNNLQMIVSMIRLQDDPGEDFESFRESLENRVASMAVVHEMLYKAEDMRSVDLGEYARRLIELLAASSPAVRTSANFDRVPCGVDGAVNFGLLLNELVLNAFKHAFGGRPGTLEVSLRADKGSARLTVRDDGPGLPADFSIEKCSNLGLRLVEALAEQLGGTLAWENTSPGVRFIVAFPAGG